MHDGSTATDNSSHGFELSLANQQSVHAVDEPRLLAAARRILEDSPYSSAVISLAVVDDTAIHELNRRYLAHDYPTDVLSFVLDERDGHLEGEVILSADTAAAAAAECGWSAGDEQLLYVIHGMLHLVGHDDTDADAARDMRAAEASCLRACGVDVPETWAEQRALAEPAPVGRGETNHANHSSRGIGIR